MIWEWRKFTRNWIFYFFLTLYLFMVVICPFPNSKAAQCHIFHPLWLITKQIYAVQKNAGMGVRIILHCPAWKLKRQMTYVRKQSGTFKLCSVPVCTICISLSTQHNSSTSRLSLLLIIVKQCIIKSKHLSKPFLRKTRDHKVACSIVIAALISH